SLLPSCSKTEGKLNDWVPVLIVALVVVCITAFLLLDPKSRTSRKIARAGPFTSRLVVGYRSETLYSGECFRAVRQRTLPRPIRGLVPLAECRMRWLRTAPALPTGPQHRT